MYISDTTDGKNLVEDSLFLEIISFILNIMSTMVAITIGMKRVMLKSEVKLITNTKSCTFYPSTLISTIMLTKVSLLFFSRCL